MSWIQALCDTYDKLEQDLDIVASGKLLKTAHSTVNVHIEVTLDDDGKFKNAGFVDKEHAVTTIPVNEDSASRGAGIMPHPLFDKLKYIAKDYSTYTGEDNAKYYSAYMSELSQWCESEFSDKRIAAVCNYLDKGSIISDLISSGIFSVDDNGYLTKKWEMAEGYKLSAGNQADAFIRFRVTGSNPISALWEDSDLQNKYSEYYLSKDADNELCYVTGKYSRSCSKHPSKIRNSGDKAKLISANDTTNFTFRGKFENSEQAYSISYEASQKAHNALKWLINHQGVRIGDKVFVLWGVNNERTPNILADTFGFMNDDNMKVDTEEEVAEGFNKSIRGYKGQLNSSSHLVLLGVDAATTGRLAVVFCREYGGLQGQQLISNIDRWHHTCRWWNSFRKEDGSYVWYYGAPTLMTIARAAFGTDQNGLLKGNDKLFAQVVERLLYCISDDQKIPRDIVKIAINKAKMPQSYSSLGQWHQVISVACALYSRYLTDYEEEDIDMAVQDTKNLAYNCGRLLAVADTLETWALLGKSDDKKSIRTTNAIRYFTRFSQRPSETWGIINKKLAVYRETLGAKGAKLYKLLGEISDKIDVEEFNKASNLGGAFVLGYDSQRLELTTKKKDDYRLEENNN